MAYVRDKEKTEEFEDLVSGVSGAQELKGSDEVPPSVRKIQDAVDRVVLQLQTLAKAIVLPCTPPSAVVGEDGVNPTALCNESHHRQTVHGV